MPGVTVPTPDGAFYLVMTDLHIFGVPISAGQTQTFNALFIVLLAPVMSILWTGLARKGLEPSIPVKFSIALVGVGLGFLFLFWGAHYADASFKVGIWWLAGLYLIHSLAELCISPVGLSMITKLSIARIVGLMMGVWFLSNAFGNKLAGYAAGFFSAMPLNQLFTITTVVLLAAAAVMFVMIKPAKRLMGNVR